MKRTYKNQFGPGYVVPEIAALVESGALVDESWGNDACPRFMINATDGLWVDHEDPTHREHYSLNRYAIFAEQTEFEDGASIMSTDDLARVLDYIQQHPRTP